MKTNRATLLLAPVLLICCTGPSEAVPYSKAVRQACKNDYHKFCGEYGLESAALRVCMDKAGRRLSRACVNALIQAGEVSQGEVEGRKQR
jgi:hypothetical protein